MVDGSGIDDPEVRSLLEASPPHTAKLATVRPDGGPHVAPVWFVLDGDRIVFTTDTASVKGRNLRRDARVALCVDDERPPFAFALLSGSVVISEEPDQLRHWASVIGGRYMGEDQAEVYGARNGVAGELLVTLAPDHVTCAHDVAL